MSNGERILAHLVGRSMAGAIVTLAAMHHPGRVASLTLVSTTPGDADLPPMSEELTRYTSSGGPDPSDPAAVVEFVVGLTKVYSGGSPYYDENAMRALAEQDVARTGNIASCLTNHFVIDFSEPVMEKAGHELPPPVWDVFVPALAQHTAR